LLIYDFSLGFYEVDVGLPDADARVMAIADMDNDKLNDLITANSAGN